MSDGLPKGVVMIGFFLGFKSGHVVQPAAADDSDFRFQCPALLNQFQQHASGGGGMNEDVSVAARAGARFVQQSRAAGSQAGDGGVEIRHAQRDVVQPGPALFEELRDGRIGGGGFQQFDARVPGGQHRDIHLFVRDGFAMGDGEAEGFVEGDGVGRGWDGDAEVVDGGRGVAPSRSRLGLLRDGGDWFDGVDQFGDAFAFGGHGAEDGAGEAFGVEFQFHAVGAGMIGLVDRRRCRRSP